MDEGSKGYYIDEEGPTYAAQSLPQYISAFATRVLQGCAAHIGMDGIRIEKEPRQETNM
jgi:hypothetical protein